VSDAVEDPRSGWNTNSRPTVSPPARASEEPGGALLAAGLPGPRPAPEAVQGAGTVLGTVQGSGFLPPLSSQAEPSRFLRRRPGCSGEFWRLTDPPRGSQPPPGGHGEAPGSVRPPGAGGISRDVGSHTTTRRPAQARQGDSGRAGPAPGRGLGGAGPAEAGVWGQVIWAGI
jgi:hypothetical protein